MLKVIFITLFFVVKLGYSQSECFIKFTQLGLLESALKSSVFFINGKRIYPAEELQRIVINDLGFDSLVYWHDGKIKTNALLKFKRGEVYIIKLNPCSFYELMPENKRRMGLAKFEKLPFKDTLVGLLDVERAQLTENKGSGYLTPITSAMCIFDSKAVSVAQKSYKLYDYDKIITNQDFHFLHGEKLSITIDESKKLRLEIIDYLK